MSAVLARWRAESRGPSLILPDGCRDLIWRQSPGAAPELFVSALDAGPRLTTCPKGTRFIGFRMRPGVSDTAAESLLAALDGEADALSRAPALIDALCAPAPRLTEALDALADAPDVAAAARRTGLAPRSLQRMLRDAGLTAPGFWVALSRARRAARLVLAGGPLAEIAIQSGYADQPHMTRALRRWFGATPAALRRDPRRASLVVQPGFGDGLTGEQISTR